MYTAPLSPHIIQQVLEQQFPTNATCWSQATDEVRDLARLARETLGLGERFAVDFRSLTSPSSWNGVGIIAIVRFYSSMTYQQQLDFLNTHSGWWETWCQNID